MVVDVYYNGTPERHAYVSDGVEILYRSARGTNTVHAGSQIFISTSAPIKIIGNNLYRKREEMSDFGTEQKCTTMRPTELRLGNIFRTKDSDRIYKVASLTPRKVGFHYGDDKNRMYYRKYCEIEPILIHDVYDKLNCPTLNWHDNTNTYYYGGFTLHGGVKYLHELQNVYFALTGKELNIEL